MTNTSDFTPSCKVPTEAKLQATLTEMQKLDAITQELWLSDADRKAQHIATAPLTGIR